MVAHEPIETILPDFASGPLTTYRKQASFDWRRLKVFIEGEERIRFTHRVLETLSKDPLFHSEHVTLSLPEFRELNHRRWKRLVEYQFISAEHHDIERTSAFAHALELYDQALGARYFLSAGVFYSALLAMGTEQHAELMEACAKNQIVGCFCLTEMSHGSNTAAVRTTATFDQGQLVFHTPDKEAVKVWAGNLAQSATHAIVFAQLYAEGQCHGLHAFALQVRDVNTLKPLPGIRIGDMGEKPGSWNAVENGWMAFDRHRAPISSLLNKGADVTADGRYVSRHKNRREQQSSSLGPLSVGRVGIVGKGFVATMYAAVIAIRYSAVRRQFGVDKDGMELPVIEYQLQQHRLFPILANAFALEAFRQRLNKLFNEYMMRSLSGEKSAEVGFPIVQVHLEIQNETGREVHALSSCAKPLATWMGVEALGEARRSCGGHGFLKCSRLNDLRNDYDPSQTFEGENHMVIQQTSNYLLSAFLDKKKGTNVTSPWGTIDFLNRNVGKWQRWSGNQVDDVIQAYHWLIIYLLSEADAKIARFQSSGLDAFSAKNQSMAGLLHSAAIAYGEMTILSWFYEFVRNAPGEFRPVLMKLCTLFGLAVVDKHITTLYMGGYTNSPDFAQFLRNERLSVERSLLPEAVSLCDALAPSDFVLRSALGHSDGRVYDHLMGEFEAASVYRAPFWADLTGFLRQQKEGGEKAKL